MAKTKHRVRISFPTTAGMEPVDVEQEVDQLPAAAGGRAKEALAARDAAVAAHVPEGVRLWKVEYADDLEAK